ALPDGHELKVLGAGVVGGRPDDLAVEALPDDERRPAGSAGDDEQRREHLLRYAHHVIRDRREPVEVGEHALGLAHYALDALGDGEHALVARLARQRARDLLDDLVARIGEGIDRVPEADDDLTPGEARADVGVGGRGRVVAWLGLNRHLVGAAVLRSAQRADRAGDAGVHIRTG